MHEIRNKRITMYMRVYFQRASYREILKYTPLIPIVINSKRIFKKALPLVPAGLWQAQRLSTSHGQGNKDVKQVVGCREIACLCVNVRCSKLVDQPQLVHRHAIAGSLVYASTRVIATLTDKTPPLLFLRLLQQQR